MTAETQPASENPESEPAASSNTEPEGSSWMQYGLVLLLVGVVVLGLLRPFYPTTSALAIGSLLALFGVFVGVLAFRERGRES